MAENSTQEDYSMDLQAQELPGPIPEELRALQYEWIQQIKHDPNANWRSDSVLLLAKDKKAFYGLLATYSFGTILFIGTLVDAALYGFDQELYLSWLTMSSTFQLAGVGFLWNILQMALPKEWVLTCPHWS